MRVLRAVTQGGTESMLEERDVVQGLPAGRSLLALLGLVLRQATSSSPSERAA